MFLHFAVVVVVLFRSSTHWMMPFLTGEGCLLYSALWFKCNLLQKYLHRPPRNNISPDTTWLVIQSKLKTTIKINQSFTIWPGCFIPKLRGKEPFHSLPQEERSHMFMYISYVFISVMFVITKPRNNSKFINKKKCKHTVVYTNNRVVLRKNSYWNILINNCKWK